MFKRQWGYKSNTLTKYRNKFCSIYVPYNDTATKKTDKS